MYWTRSIYPRTTESVCCLSMRPMKDGSSLMAGNIGTKLTGAFLAVKLKPDGSLGWMKTYGEPRCSLQLTCLESWRTNFALGGFAPQGECTPAIVLRINGAGSTGGAYAYGARGYEVIPAAFHDWGDGALTLVGRIADQKKNRQNFLYLEIDSKGKIIVQRVYDYQFVKPPVQCADETAIDIARASATSTLVAGHLRTATPTNDVWFAEIDRKGTVLNYAQVGRAQADDQLTGLTAIADPKAKDPCFAFCGFTRQSIAKTFDVLVGRCVLTPLCPPNTGRRLAIAWANAYRVIGCSSYAYEIIQVPDGDLVVVGSTWRVHGNNPDALILKIRAQDGALIWSRFYGSAGNAGTLYCARRASAANDFVTGGINTAFPRRTAHSPFPPYSVTDLTNMWILNLNGVGECPDSPAENIDCVRLGHDMEPAPSDLDWVPNCLDPDKPVLSKIKLSASLYKAPAANLRLKGRPTCAP